MADDYRNVKNLKYAAFQIKVVRLETLGTNSVGHDSVQPCNTVASLTTMENHQMNQKREFGGHNIVFRKSDDILNYCLLCKKQLQTKHIKP